MTVHFVGAGPGAADLMTLRGQRVISAADVVVYAGALVPPEVLTWCKSDAVLHDSQHLSLDEIIELCRGAYDAGHQVARLQSGDPALYSAMAEQMRRLTQLGIPFEVVPGVPAFSAAAAVLRRELTVPEVAQSIILTRVSRRATAMPPGEQLAAFAATGATLVVHLAVQVIDEVVAEVVDHYGAACPVAVCAFVSQPAELMITGTLADIAQQVADHGVTKTAVIIIGPALTASQFGDSHLYSCARQFAKRIE